MDFLEYSLRYDVVQISLHKFEDEVNIPVVLGANGFMQLYYVWMVKLPKNFYLTVGALGISCVLESVKYLF
jgi:hypothetical protein